MSYLDSQEKMVKSIEKYANLLYIPISGPKSMQGSITHKRELLYDT